MVINNQPVKQHTVPNTYLRNFADKNGMLWVYDRETHEYREQPSNATTIERDFYTFEDVEGQQNYQLEKEMASTIENKLTPIIEKIHNKYPLDEKDKSNLATFVALQKARTTYYRKNYEDLVEAFGEITKKFFFSDKTIIQESIEKYKKDTGNKINLNA